MTRMLGWGIKYIVLSLVFLFDLLESVLVVECFFLAIFYVLKLDVHLDAPVRLFLEVVLIDGSRKVIEHFLEAVFVYQNSHGVGQLHVLHFRKGVILVKSL